MMPMFDAKIIDSDPDGLPLLAAVLHPTKQAQAEALRRGRERLAHAASLSEAMARAPRSVNGCCAAAV